MNCKEIDKITNLIYELRSNVYNNPKFIEEFVKQIQDQNMDITYREDPLGGLNICIRGDHVDKDFIDNIYTNEIGNAFKEIILNFTYESGLYDLHNKLKNYEFCNLYNIIYSGGSSFIMNI